MKKFLLLVITGVILHNGLCFAADEDNVAPAVESESAAATAQTGNQGNSNFENMGRGLINIGTCFVEIPRGLIYCNSEMPFWGFIDILLLDASVVYFMISVSKKDKPSLYMFIPYILWLVIATYLNGYILINN